MPEEIDHSSPFNVKCKTDGCPRKISIKTKSDYCQPCRSMIRLAKKKAPQMSQEEIDSMDNACEDFDLSSRSKDFKKGVIRSKKVGKKAKDNEV